MVSMVWFRNDLRLSDNPALQDACKQGKILPVYIYDPAYLNPPLGQASRWWLHQSLVSLSNDLQAKGSNLFVFEGDTNAILLELAKKYDCRKVFWNETLDPEANKLEGLLKKTLTQAGIQYHSFKTQVLVDPTKIMNTTGHYFSVFTPFWKACLKHGFERSLVAMPKEIPTVQIPKYNANNAINELKLMLKNSDFSASYSKHWVISEAGAKNRLAYFLKSCLSTYDLNRDFPALDNTSKLSPYLRFGQLTPMQIVHEMKKYPRSKHSDRFLTELGWREFAYYLLFHFPQFPQKNFKPKFDGFRWQMNETFLKRWQMGETGYPIVDAGMRQLLETGWMHNRVRMIVASFLVKDLLIDWRLGAEWFWDKLVDADLANNSLGWQWVAGSGPDAAPYFRIFNPTTQSKKFDAHGEYIKHWVSELSTVSEKFIHDPHESIQSAHEDMFENGKGNKIIYPAPMIDHDAQRKIALAYYNKLSKNVSRDQTP